MVGREWVLIVAKGRARSAPTSERRLALTVSYLAAVARAMRGLLVLWGFFALFTFGQVLTHEVAHFAGAGVMPEGIRLAPDAESFQYHNAMPYWRATPEGNEYQHISWRFNGIVLYTDNLVGSIVTLGVWLPHADPVGHGIAGTIGEAFIPEGPPPPGAPWLYAAPNRMVDAAPTFVWICLVPISFYLCWRRPVAWRAAFAISSAGQPLSNVHHWLDLGISPSFTTFMGYAILFLGFVVASRYVVASAISGVWELVVKDREQARQAIHRERMLAQAETDREFARTARPVAQWNYVATLRRD